MGIRKEYLVVRSEARTYMIGLTIIRELRHIR